jgi:predicted amidohydrolase
VPSAFTFVTGQAHWELLLRARAIENLAYVAAPAQGGMHENGRQHLGPLHGGRPLGRVLARREGEAVVLAELDCRSAAAGAYLQLPALEHRVL